MISTYSGLALMLASQVLASPVLRRQEPTASAATTNVVTVSSTTTEASMMSSMTASSAAPAATTAGGNNAAYPCPPGYLLTYAEASRDYNYPVETLAQYAGNFQNASYFGYLNGTGGNTIGATRNLVSGHNETLVEFQENMGGLAVFSSFNLTNGPITVGNGIMVSNYSTVLQVFTNTTASPLGNISTAKIFSNFCASDQAGGQMAQLNAFMQALDNINNLILTGSPIQATRPVITETAAASTTVEPVTQTVSSTQVAAVPTAVISTTLTAEASTVTASTTVVPEVITQTTTGTDTPQPSTATAVVVVTPGATTQVASVTVTPDASTVTAETTVNPLSTAQSTVVAVSTTTA